MEGRNKTLGDTLGGKTRNWIPQCKIGCSALRRAHDACVHNHPDEILQMSEL